jgi:hypothetical protein
MTVLALKISLLLSRVLQATLTLVVEMNQPSIAKML